MPNHNVSWNVSITITGNRATASYELHTNTTPHPRGAVETNPGDGGIKVHKKHRDVSNPADDLKIEYNLVSSGITFTCFQFVQDPVEFSDADDFIGGLNFDYKDRAIQNGGRRFSFKDGRKSQGTWKLLFSIRDATKEYLIDPEITNTDVDTL